MKGKKKDILWSFSTTIRSPDERIINFLKTAAEIEGQDWNFETQMRYQSLLIKNRYYTPTTQKLTQKQIVVLQDYTHNLTYKEAREIFEAKNYEDPPMRGRTSFNPIEKLGLVTLCDVNNPNKVVITALGRKFIEGSISITDVFTNFLLKFQYPNPLSKDCRTYNTKPFINTLRLIKRVNELCVASGLKAKGISREEFGIFALSIRNYDEIDEKAVKLLDYRNALENITDFAQREAYRQTYIKRELAEFNNPVKNTLEYTDNMIRCLRITKYIYIRGGGYYIDLEPRRVTEIEAIIANDDGRAIEFENSESYTRYLTDMASYSLPFETVETLTEIAKSIIAEINSLHEYIADRKHENAVLPDNVTDLKKTIEELRNIRQLLQNEKIKIEYQEIDKIDTAVEKLKLISRREMREMKPSIAFEKWANVSLNIIDDAKLIKPNAPVVDDNEPTFTAPGDVADIECFYDNFSAICEVTTLTSRDQWFNEGQPVMRHLRKFENEAGAGTESYCLFIAPSIHADTANTFWYAVKYEYEGRKQRIIPLTITQFTEILDIVKQCRRRNMRLAASDMKTLYDACVAVDGISSSTEWLQYVQSRITDWKNSQIRAG